jgi:hypothetical protein
VECGCGWRCSTHPRMVGDKIREIRLPRGFILYRVNNDAITFLNFPTRLPDPSVPVFYPLNRPCGSVALSCWSCSTSLSRWVLQGSVSLNPDGASPSTVRRVLVVIIIASPVRSHQSSVQAHLPHSRAFMLILSFSFSFKHSFNSWIWIRILGTTPGYGTTTGS